MRWLACSILVACEPTTPPPETVVLPRAVVANVTATPDIAIDTHAADSHEWSLRATGFPAISEDGSQVVDFVKADPEGRGYPDDTFYIERVSDDRAAFSLQVFKGLELGQIDDTPALPGIRIRAANLQSLLARQHWSSMRAARQIAPSTFEHRTFRLTLDGTSAALTENGEPRRTLDASGWKLQDIPPDSMSAFPCRYAAEIARASFDLERHVLAIVVHNRLLEGTSCGTHDVPHVFRW